MIAFLILLASSGLLFFASVETAFTLLMRLPQRLEAEREREADALHAYLDDPVRFFVPARLMRGTLLVVALVLLAQHVEAGWVGAGVLFGTGVGLAIGVGQILPALLVRRSPERVLDLLLPVFTIVANVLSPLTVIITSFLRASPRRRNDEAGEAEGSTEPAPSEAEAPAQADERRLLRSVVDFGETLVREVMTPRPDIVAIRADATIDDLRRLVQEQEYSRLPVFAENLDNIVGLVVVKDLIQRTDAPAAGVTVKDIKRPAVFVPETKRVMDLLRQFQRERAQLAIVVDEYGGTAGLVTVEDVVEELVGEIRDEYDSDAEPIVQESADTYVFSAKVATSEMTERLGIEIDDGEFETVGGYVLSRVGRVPAVGERFSFDGIEVEILEAERRRIHKVRLRRLPPAPDTDA
jgi:putative hemolysin